MVRKKKEEVEFESIAAPVAPLLPLYSNIPMVLSHEQIVVLDFGLVAPDYSKPKNIKETQVARICLPWDSAEVLSELLGKAISERKKKTKEK